MLNSKSITEAALDLRKAMETPDSNVEGAIEDFGKVVANDALAQFQQDFDEYNQTHDQSILERRGVHMLTSAEEKFYNKVIDVMRSGNPKQAFVEIIGSADEDDIMPNTIIEDVFRNLATEHPLLSRIQYQDVGYLTKWILNKHAAQKAAWGAITAEITQEITSDLKVVDIKQNKLSCYVILEQGMVDLGPAWLDSYVRQVMTETMAYSLECAVVSGSGDGEPAGMDRDLTNGTYGTGYAKKTAVAVTSFEPAAYGELLAGFAKDEDGHARTVRSVMLVCNQNDYFTKIMPATTALTAVGTYVNNLFPFATDVVVSNVLNDGEAILGIADEYYLFIGRAARNNVIQYSDDYKFLEDQRVFKVVQYADGRAYDNTSFQLLDISKLESLVIPVKTVSAGEGEAA